jgi:hypothetical protein
MNPSPPPRLSVASNFQAISINEACTLVTGIKFIFLLESIVMQSVWSYELILIHRGNSRIPVLVTYLYKLFVSYSNMIR